MTKKIPQALLNKKAKKLKRHLDELDLPERKNLQAVAVRYRPGKDKAPIIVATGKANVAEKILQLAEEHRIPFYEDSTLTDLLAKLNLNMEVPAELYTLVAEVLAFVYQLDKMAKNRRKR
ncbi:FhlB domain-containing protein [bacterium]|nr:FhlB domain-containing protein [bacterium]